MTWDVTDSDCFGFKSTVTVQLSICVQYAKQAGLLNTPNICTHLHQLQQPVGILLQNHGRATQCWCWVPTLQDVTTSVAPAATAISCTQPICSWLHLSVRGPIAQRPTPSQ